MHCGLFGLLDVAIRPPYPLALSQTFKRILFDDTLHCSAINADVTALVMPPPITRNNMILNLCIYEERYLEMIADLVVLLYPDISNFTFQNVKILKCKFF